MELGRRDESGLGLPCKMNDLPPSHGWLYGIPIMEFQIWEVNTMFSSTTASSQVSQSINFAKFVSQPSKAAGAEKQEAQVKPPKIDSQPIVKLGTDSLTDGVKKQLEPMLVQRAPVSNAIQQKVDDLFRRYPNGGSAVDSPNKPAVSDAAPPQNDGVQVDLFA